MKNYISTGSIIAFKYKNGVITATDTHGAYGHLSRFDNLTRTFKLTSHCIISYSGEYSDIQALHKMLKYMLMEDKKTIKPQGIQKIVQRILYSRRSKMQPLNVFCIVIGTDEDTFLGAVNHLGNFYSADVISNSLGAHLAVPHLRELIEGKKDDIEREEAVKIMDATMQLLFYKDCYANNKYIVGITEKDFCEISEQKTVTTEWELARKYID